MHTRPRTMRRTVATTLALLFTVSACGSDGDDAAQGTTTTAPEIADTTTTADTSGTTIEREVPVVDLEGALFYAPPVEGAQLVLDVDSDVGVSDTATVMVNAVERSDAGITVWVSEVSAGDGGEPVTSQRRYTTAPDGSLSVSADAFVAQGPGFEVTAAGDDVRIPNIEELASGQETGGRSFVEIAGGSRLDVDYRVSGAGTESLTTPLGTFDVQLVDVELTISSSFAPDQDGTIRYSLLPGYGVLATDISIAGIEIVTTLASATVEP